MRLLQELLRSRPLRGPRLMLVAVHVPVIALAPLYAIFGSIDGLRPSGHPWLAVLSGAMIFGLQLRHSLALARGERPRGGVWTLLALAVLAYAPLHWLGADWLSEQFAVLASVPMVFGGWLAAVVLAGPCVYLGIELAGLFPAHPGIADYIYWIPYYTVSITVPCATLYASARLVRVAGELRATRIALAEAAVGRERLRVSRDLHDLLGHSLAAISLKGDLAIRLLRRDTPAALAEIRDLTEVAREALTGLRAITGDERTVTLARELENAQALLAAAGVAVPVHGAIPDIPPAAEEVLAWTVREGVTNILRHATAGTAEITLECRDGLARLEILNDGAYPPAGDGGYGLSGLAGRIQELSGTLSHGRLSDGRFQLVAQVPVTSSEESSWTASECSSPKTST